MPEPRAGSNSKARVHPNLNNPRLRLLQVDLLTHGEAYFYTNSNIPKKFWACQFGHFCHHLFSKIDNTVIVWIEGKFSNFHTVVLLPLKESICKLNLLQTLYHLSFLFHNYELPLHTLELIMCSGLHHKIIIIIHGHSFSCKSPRLITLSSTVRHFNFGKNSSMKLEVWKIDVFSIWQKIFGTNVHLKLNTKDPPKT